MPHGSQLGLSGRGGLDFDLAGYGSAVATGWMAIDGSTALGNKNVVSSSLGPVLKALDTCYDDI